MKQKQAGTFALALLALLVLGASHAASGCHEGAATTPTSPPPSAVPPSAVPPSAVPPSAVPSAEPSAAPSTEPSAAPSVAPSAAPSAPPPTASASASAGPASSIVPLGSARRDPLEVLRAHCKQWMAGPEQMEDWQKAQCQAIVGGAPPGK
ncbi:MAG: hypothetical protein IT373_22305 [Polyangiaceae bacterium]|nr:hypothetical protein [Polyangiaceae bacterium]